MAAVSFSMSRNGGASEVLAAGSQTVTEGSSAPGAGDIEVRLADGVAWTQNEIEIALDVIAKFIHEKSTAYPI